MKKKTLFTLLAACLLSMGLTSCFCYDSYGYGHYRYDHYGYDYHRPAHRSYRGGHNYHHGPNAEMTPEAQVLQAE